MSDIFIKNIKINYSRNVRQTEIPVSDYERKHLIITGKNGSGKTSLLNAIRNNLLAKVWNWHNLPKNYLVDIRSGFQKNSDKLSEEINTYSRLVKSSRNEYIDSYGALIDMNQRQKREYESFIQYINPIISEFPIPVEAILNNEDNLQLKINKREFILSFFSARRQLYAGNPDGINKDDPNYRYKFLENVNNNFLQYIVNLRADQAFAKEAGDRDTTAKIEKWFFDFTNLLKVLFGKNDLQLKFDRRSYNFYIIEGDRNAFDFNSMSDGYSSILAIVSEIMLRIHNPHNEMVHKPKFISYDTDGIVIIDEIENHLHIELQKKILPFLISFFPNIQFIVSTHSPFVLSSISNSVIYDLENKTRVEDLSGYSLDGIVESYFLQDKYSTEVKLKLEEYEYLILNKDRSEDENDRLFFLKRYFKELPKFFSTELKLKLQQLDLASI